MPVERIVTGASEREINGPFKPPIWDGNNGLRNGQQAYDNTGAIDGSPGPIYWDGVQWVKFSSGAASSVDYGDGVVDLAGFGQPEGLIVAAKSSTYRQKDGEPGAVFWIKQSGLGNTGWAPIA